MRNITGATVAIINSYSDKVKEKISKKPTKMLDLPSYKKKSAFLCALVEAQPKTICFHLFADHCESFKSSGKTNVCRFGGVTQLASMSSYRTRGSLAQT